MKWTILLGIILLASGCCCTTTEVIPYKQTTVTRIATPIVSPVVEPVIVNYVEPMDVTTTTIDFY